MFQFPEFPPDGLCIHPPVTGLPPAGFPHSDIKGSMPACGSPLLFAACHVLLRRLVPWHPPCALRSLPRPSSALGALASTLCSSSLNYSPETRYISFRFLSKILQLVFSRLFLVFLCAVVKVRGRFPGLQGPFQNPENDTEDR